LIEAGIGVDMGVLVADNEFITMIRQIVGGIPTNDDTMMIEEIVKFGPEAEYISSASTLRNVHQLGAPVLMDRHSREEWTMAGSTDMYTRVCAEARRILADTEVTPLPDDVDAKLTDIVSAADAKYAGA
jgi:trimethylamine---corrinoid protein Co-methyltransferase